MDKTIKDMCNQLRRGYYGKTITEAVTSIQSGESESGAPESDISDIESGDGEGKNTFSETSDVWKKFRDSVKPLIQTVPASFHEIDYFPSNQKAQWSGTIGNGINWTAYYGNDGKGFYITSENSEMTPEYTKALLRLNLYFDTKWAEEIQTAIDNKDFLKPKE